MQQTWSRVVFVIIQAFPRHVHWLAAVSITSIKDFCCWLSIFVLFTLSLQCLTMVPPLFQVFLIMNFKTLSFWRLYLLSLLSVWEVSSRSLSSLNLTVVIFLLTSDFLYFLEELTSLWWEIYWPFLPFILFLFFLKDELYTLIFLFSSSSSLFQKLQGIE